MFKEYVEIKNYPLFYGPLKEELLSKLTKKANLKLGYDSDLDIIRLDIDENLKKILAETYEVGSNPSVSLGKGKIQSRILDSIVKEIELLSDNKDNFSITEIGCGEGRLLAELSKKNWRLQGFEIAPTVEVAQSLINNGVRLVQDYYSYDKLEDLSDMIFSYGVLEHIIELKEFFIESIKGLKENGIFCHIVPDCEHMLEQGNINIISHQHVNYFTRDSLMSLYKKFGFKDVQYKIITPGNGLMVYGYKEIQSKKVKLVESSKSLLNINLLKSFAFNFNNSLNKLDDFLELYKTKNIVFYAGGMPFYLLLNRKENIIFTDSDNELFDKKFYLELPKIVSPNFLKGKKVDFVIVFASHYYQEIRKYLLEEIGLSLETEIKSIDEIIE